MGDTGKRDRPFQSKRAAVFTAAASIVIAFNFIYLAPDDCFSILVIVFTPPVSVAV